jgi:hypothetical protein
LPELVSQGATFEDELRNFASMILDTDEIFKEYAPSGM